MRRWIAAAAVVAMTLTSAQEVRANSYGQYDGPLSYIFFTWVYIQGTGVFVFETDDLMPTSGDTVMYLVQGSPFQQVGYNDDYGGSLRSLIAFNKTIYHPDGYYLLVVRGYNTFSGGTCNIYVTPPGHRRELMTGTAFGGYIMNTSTVVGDQAFAVPMDEDTLDTVLFAFNSRGSELLWFDDDSGVGRSALLQIMPTEGAKIAAGKKDPSQGSGSGRVVLNDASGSDSDGDGFGSQLENALCTCDYQWQTTCEAGTPRACIVGQGGLYNLKDTDGDGIQDNYEVVGKDGPTAPFLPPFHPGHLPMWGASPVHKDLFIEADWFLGLNAMQWETAENIARIYSQTGTAASLKNPDGLDGVRVHLDIGRVDPYYGTVYGDWGGATQVPANNDPPDSNRFADVRRGVFHYVALSPPAGHQTGTGWQFFCHDDTSGKSCVHELGHNLSLLHGGRVSAVDQMGKPNYKSIMSYAVMDQLDVFSLGTMPDLNPTALSEPDGLQQTDRLELSYLMPPSPWSLTVESPPNDANPYWAIDWNRDGAFSGGGPVRAAPNYHLGACYPELGRYHWQHKGEFKHDQGTWTIYSRSDTTPDVKRVWNRINLAYVDDQNRVNLLHTAHDFHTGCTGLLSTCATWTRTQAFDTQPGVGPALGVHHAYLQDYLVVVHADTVIPGKWRYQVINSGYGLVRNEWVPMTSTPRGEPVLANHGDDLVLVWVTGPAGEVGTVYANTMTPESTQFGAAVPQQADNGWGMGVRFVNALANHPGGLRGLFTQKFLWPNAGFTWYEYEGDGLWASTVNTDIEAIESFPVNTEYAHRMGLSYLADPSLPGGGRWYLLFKRYAAGTWPKGEIWIAHTQGYGQGNETWGNLGRYDTIYFETYAGASTYAFGDGQAETNLRLAIAQKLDEYYYLAFRPFADGIYDVALKDCNDFVVMERGLCGGLHGCKNLLCTHDGSSACPGGE